MFYGSDDVLSRFSVLFNKFDPKKRGPYKDEGTVIVPVELHNTSDFTIDVLESMESIRIKGEDGFVYHRGQGKFKII